MDTEQEIPDHISEKVHAEAVYASRNFCSGQSIQIFKYEEFYKRYVTPYAQRNYILEQLVVTKQEEIKQLRAVLDQAADLLNQALSCIDSLIIK
jgi:hypothetical protein